MNLLNIPDDIIRYIISQFLSSDDYNFFAQQKGSFQLLKFLLKYKIPYEDKGETYSIIPKFENYALSNTKKLLNITRNKYLRPFGRNKNRVVLYSKKRMWRTTLKKISLRIYISGLRKQTQQNS